MANFFDQFDAPSSSGNFFDQFDEKPEAPKPEKPGLIRSLADVALEIPAGAANATKALADAFGAGSEVSRSLGNTAEMYQGMQSPARQAERQAQAQRSFAAEQSGSTWEEVKAAGQNFFESPVSASANAAGSLVPIVAGGLIASRLGVKPTAATGALSGGMGAGAVKGSIYDDQLKRAQEAGLSPEQAQAKATAAQAYSGPNTDQIALGAGLGVLAGSTGVERVLGGATSGIKSLVGRIGAGAVQEALPEAAQGGQERLAANVAAQRAGYDASTWQGVAGQATSEGLASAAPGSLSGGMTRYAPPVDPNAGPLSRAAATAQQTGTAGLAQAAQPAQGAGVADDATTAAGAATDPIAARLAGVASFAEDKEFLRALRTDARYGPESVTELLGAYATARNPQADPTVRDNALNAIEQFTGAFVGPNAFGGKQDFTMPNEPDTFVREPREQTGIVPFQGGALAQPGADPFDPNTLDGQAREVGTLPRQMLAGPEDAAAQYRRELLDSVLSDPETKNPLPRYESLLKKNGFEQRRATPDERKLIEDRTVSRTETVPARAELPPFAAVEQSRRAAFPMTQTGAERRAAEQSHATGRAFEAVPHPTIKGRFAVQPVAAANTTPERVAQTPGIEQVEPTNSLSRTASWVIREKGTGAVVMETFDRKKVDALNTDKYEAVPIQEHLASLNRQPTNALLNSGEIGTRDGTQNRNTPMGAQAQGAALQAGTVAQDQESGGQSVLPRAAETASQSGVIPQPVRARLSDALTRLQEIRKGIDDAVTLERRFGSVGRYQADALTNRMQDIEKARKTLADFRRIAPNNGVDAEAVIAEMGGEPDFTPSKEAQAWLNDPRGAVTTEIKGTPNEKAPQALPSEAQRGTAQQAETVAEQVRDATLREAAVADRAEPVLDLSKRPTGWKQVDYPNGDGVLLISADGKKAINFPSRNAKSGTEALRAQAKAQAFAIDNPHSTESPKGELVVKPIFEKQAQQAEVTQKIAKAEQAGVTLSDADKATIQRLQQEADDLTRKADRLGISDPMNKGNAFPMGVGFTKMTKRKSQAIDASVRRAGDAVKLYNAAKAKQEQVQRMLSGVDTDAHRAAQQSKKEQAQRELVSRLVNWKKGDKIGKFTIERVSKDKDGYPTSYTISGEGVIKGVMDKTDIARDFFGGDKEKLRRVVDEVRNSNAPEPSQTLPENRQESRPQGAQEGGAQAPGQGLKRIPRGEPKSLLELIRRSGGISSKLASDIAGERTAGKKGYPVGVFRSNGMAEDMLAELLQQNGFLSEADITNPDDTSGAGAAMDLVRAALAGERVTSIAEREREMADAEERQYRDTIRQQASEAGIKTAFRKFSDIETEVLTMRDRKAQAEADALEQEDRAAYDELLADVRAVLDDAEIESLIERNLNTPMRDMLGLLTDAYDAKIAEINAELSSARAPRDLNEQDYRDAFERENAASDGQADARAAREGQANGRGAAGNRQTQADGFSLESQTPQDLAARDAAQRETAEREQREQQERERKAQADTERGSFTLTGSDRAADVQAAMGQGGLFDGQSATPTSPEPRAEQGQQADTGADKIKRSFAGESARTADTHALATAQRRIAAGEDAEVVRQETGWHKAPDGKWRFEIDDSEASILPALQSLGRGGYDAREIASVTYRKRDDGTYDLTLNPPNPKETSDFVTLTAVRPEVMRAVLPDAAARAVERNAGAEDFIGDFEEAKRIDAAFTFDGFNALPLDQAINHPALFAAYPALRDVMVQVDPKMGIGGAFSLVDHSDGTTSQVIRIGKGQQLSTLLHEIQHGIQNIEGFATGGSITQEIKAAHDLLGGASPVKGKTLEQYAFDRYKRSAGETEARNTQARQNLTAAERREQSPESTADVKASDVIVVFNGTEMASAPAPANAAQTGTTPTAIWQAVESLVGPIRRRRIVVVQSANELVAQGILTAEQARGAQAFVKDGKAYFIADAIQPGNERAVFLHEVGAHLGMERILSPLQRSVLLNRIKTWAAQDNGSQESRIAQAALRRVEAAGVTGSDAESELLAYFVEEAVKSGINPTTDTAGPIGQWFKTLWNAMRTALEKLGLVNASKLTAQDIVNLAHGAANVAMGEEVQSSDPRIQFSRAAAIPNAEAVSSKARDFLADVVKRPGTFGVLSRTLQTQYHKATKNPQFKAVWTRAHAMFMDASRAMSRPADLAPDLLPKFDLSNMGKAAQAVFGRGQTDRADIKAVADVLSAGTLAGGAGPMEGVVWNDKQLTEDGVRVGDKFVKLTAKQLKLYKEARAAIDASLDESAAAEAWKLLRRHTTDADMRNWIAQNPQDAPGAVADTLATVIEQETAKLEDLQLAAEANPSKDADRAIAKQQAVIADLKDTEERTAAIFDKAATLKEAGYMPLMRFGQFRIAVTTPDGKGEKIAYVSRYESAFEANRARRQLMQDFPASEGFTVGAVEVTDQDAWKQFKGVSPETVMLFAKESGIAADEVMQAWYKEAVASRSSLRRMVHRKGYQGFSDDLPRVLASFITSNGKAAGYAYHLADMQQMMQDETMPGDVHREARELLETITQPTEKGANVRGVMASWYLLGSIASAIVNSTQTLTMSLPFLSQFGSKGFAPGEAMGHLSRAYGQAFGKIKDKALADAVKRAEEAGIVDSNEVFHLYAEAMKPMIAKLGSGSVAYRARAFMTLWGAPFAIVEKLNRKSTFIAAYMMAKAQGKTDAQAFDFGERAVTETQGIYAVHNRPNWARGAVGGAILTFRQFSIAYLELASRMWQSGPEGKKAAGLMLGILFLTAGLSGLPGEDDLLDLIDTFSQTFLGKSTVSKMELRNWLNDTLGKELGAFVNSGVSAFLPLDVSGRMGMGNLLPGTALFKPSEPDPKREMLEVLGVPGSFAMSAIEGAKLAMQGEGTAAIKAFAPKAVQDVVKGAEMLRTGEARDLRGRKIVDVGVADAFWQSIGFNPSVKAEAGRRAFEVNEMIGYNKRKESEIVGRLARGVADRDQEVIQSAQQDLVEWNQRNPETPILINRRQVQQRIMQLQMERSGRIVKMAPPELRRRVSEALEEE